MERSSSHPIANRAPYVLAKDGILLLSSGSSSLIPTIWRPEAPYLAFSCCSFGKELLHGVQNVPQKSRRTTLPRSPLSETFPRDPATAATLKSGAGLPTRPDGSPGDEDDGEGEAPGMAPPHPIIAATAAATSATTWPVGRVLRRPWPSPPRDRGLVSGKFVVLDAG